MIASPNEDNTQLFVCIECQYAEQVRYVADGTLYRNTVILPHGTWGEEVKPIDLPTIKPLPGGFSAAMKQYMEETYDQLLRSVMIPAAEFEPTSTASQAATHQAMDGAEAIKKLIREWSWKAAFRKQLSSDEGVDVHGSTFAPRDKIAIMPGVDGKWFIICHKDMESEVRQIVEHFRKRLTSEAT